jgi:iron complex outermembrane recepter protein
MSRSHRLVRPIAGTFFFSLLLWGSLPAANAQDDEFLEEIIVSARKMEEGVQKVPLAVQVLTAETLDNLNIEMFDNFAEQTPSMTFLGAGPGSPGGSQMFMRGVSDGGNANFGTSSPSAAVYLDELPLTTIGAVADWHIYDLSRIEVLPGPQGTLYGASSQSGTVKIVTNRPNTEKFESGVDVTYGSYTDGGDNLKIEGFVNVPLGDNAALRVIGYSLDYGGYIDSVDQSLFVDALITTPDGAVLRMYQDAVTTRFVEKDHNTVKRNGARAQLLYDINNDWSVIASLAYQDDEGNGTWYHTPDSRGLWWGNPTSDLSVARYSDEFSEDTLMQFAVTVKGSLGFADLTYAGGYLDRTFFSQFDWLNLYMFLNSPALACDRNVQFPAPPHWSNPAINYRNDCGNPEHPFWTDAEYTRSVHELRLTSTNDGPLSYTLGFFYDDFSNDYDLYGYGPNILQENLIAGARDGAVWDSFNQRTDKQTAIFGELTYAFSDSWAATVGARWFDQETEILIDNFLVFPDRVPFRTEHVTDESDTTYKLSLAWQATDNALLYATWSEGFRQGGPNRGDAQTNPLVPDGYAADFLTNYEFGWKTQFAGGRFTFNGAVFLMEWADFQNAILDTNLSSFGFVDNVGNADIDGLEIEMRWAATENLDFGAGFATYDAKLTEDAVNPSGLVQIPKGTKLPWVPEEKGYLNTNYSFDVNAAWAGYGRLTYSYTGSSQSALANPIKQDSSSILNFQFGFVNGPWEYQFFATNLTDERAERLISDGGFGTLTNAPQQFGVAVKWRSE